MDGTDEEGIPPEFIWKHRYGKCAQELAEAKLEVERLRTCLHYAELAIAAEYERAQAAIRALKPR